MTRELVTFPADVVVSGYGLGVGEIRARPADGQRAGQFVVEWTSPRPPWPLGRHTLRLPSAYYRLLPAGQPFVSWTPDPVAGVRPLSIVPEL